MGSNNKISVLTIDVSIIMEILIREVFTLYFITNSIP